MHECTICHKILPDSQFYKSNLKRYQYQCIKCCVEKCYKYNSECEKLAENDFNRYYGGYVISVINYVRPKEYKYTIKGTDGFIVQTNDVEYFKKKFDELVLK